MEPVRGQRSFERVDELVELLWRQERVLVAEPAVLEELAELCPAASGPPNAGRPLDLDTLNGLLEGRGLAAAWEDEGLTFFRIPEGP